MTSIQQSKAAAAFVAHWTGKGYEKGESQIFWTTLLNQIFGIEHPEQFITFEQQVHLDHTSFIDAFIPSTHVMIEQKSYLNFRGDNKRKIYNTLRAQLPMMRPYSESNFYAYF